jgi:hypothetical protein
MQKGSQENVPVLDIRKRSTAFGTRVYVPEIAPLPKPVSGPFYVLILGKAQKWDPTRRIAPALAAEMLYLATGVVSVEEEYKPDRKDHLRHSVVPQGL